MPMGHVPDHCCSGWRCGGRHSSRDGFQGPGDGRKRGWLLQIQGFDLHHFPPTGGLLSTGSKREQAQARFDAGMKFDMQTRNFDVKIYGDTAVSTYYTVGMVRRSAESEPERWNLRMTSVWVKEAGEWKLVHRHESHLTLR
ncbi:MAG: nuclear transport factor 2 family protein [Acidobacteria bacterium]|nr:nuclear transport factor 2 family protein [Acidobacteriota bacterium]